MLVFREEISRYQLTLQLRQDIYYNKLSVDMDALALMGIRATFLVSCYYLQLFVACEPSTQLMYSAVLLL